METLAILIISLLHSAENDPIALIAAQEQRIPDFEAKLAARKDKKVPVFYSEADFEIAKRFCRYCRDDVKNNRGPRALEVAKEVKELLDRAEAELGCPVDVPVLDKTSPIAIRDGSFWSSCRLGDKTETRPVFLTGYGHFRTAVDDLPLFSRIGINVIQIEIGPSSTVFEDGVRTDEITSRILPALDRARDNGVRVCLLISPHYFPEWALKKWPELKIDGEGFLKNSLDAPQARAIYEKHLRALIPLIKDHPALESICLSNEPVFEASQKDPFRLPLWHEYIKKVHGTVENLNAAYGTQYKSFDAVPHPGFKHEKNLSALYDAVRFNQERFAEFHAWMVGIIHQMAPNLPCHAKVMCLPEERGTMFWGTDPWDFARLSQINGNDCSFLQNPAGGQWMSRWQPQNMYYDLERSMKRVPVFNTENHIIRDREKGLINPNHIYAAIWQGAIHGQGASATWVWERTYDAKSDFEGSILHRPACAAAMSRCALDLMRLSNEVAAVQNVEPRIAILYSHAASVRENHYVPSRTRLYEALNFCGVPIGFITDEQIAAGLLKNYRCLLLPKTRFASRAAMDGIQAFAKAGGAVAGFGPIDADEYGKEVEKVAPTIVLEHKDGEPLRNELAQLLAKRKLAPEMTLDAPYGVEWRTAACNGHVVVNAINLTQKPVKMALPEGAWTDLIKGAPIDRPVSLEPDVPVLARKN